jgi:uncharacterized protein
MLTLITKPTDECNAACVYCSVGDKARTKTRMTEQTVRLLFERIREFLAGTNESVYITWHGGEPMLLGSSFYELVAKIEEEIAGEYRDRILHTMQSNLTLLNDSYRRVFQLLRINMVGTSFEFVPELRGLGAKVDWRLYNRRFFEATEKLNELGIGWGIVYVVTSRSVHRPDDVINFCLNLVSRSGAIRLNTLYLEGAARRPEVAHLGVTPEEFGHFLGRVFQIWFERRDSVPSVEPLQSYYDYYLGKTDSLCCDESGSCGRSHLGIGPEGNIYQCGRSMDADVLQYGNLATHSFCSVWDHPLKEMLLGRSQLLSEADCAECDCFDWCHGGCPVDGYIYKGDWFKSTNWCEARRILFRQYFVPTMRGAGLAAARRTPRETRPLKPTWGDPIARR